MRCARIGNSSIVFGAAVFRGERCWSAASWSTSSPTRRRRPRSRCRRSCAICCRTSRPASRCSTCAWAPGIELGREAQAIRTAVFVQEQRIPAELEWDAADANCVHAVAYNRFGMALGTGRLLEHEPGVAKIGRMAVLQAMRGADVGRAVLDALIDAARRARRARGAAACAEQRGAASTPAPASRRAASPSRRPASRTWRWCARCSGFSRGDVGRVAGVEDLDVPRARAASAAARRCRRARCAGAAPSSMPGAASA